MNWSRARSICFVERNRFRVRRKSSIGSSKTPFLKQPKRRKYLFCQAEVERPLGKTPKAFEAFCCRMLGSAEWKPFKEGKLSRKEGVLTDLGRRIRCIPKTLFSRSPERLREAPRSSERLQKLREVPTGSEKLREAFRK